MKTNAKMNRKPQSARGYGIRTKVHAGFCFVIPPDVAQKTIISDVIKPEVSCSGGADGMIGCCVNPKATLK